jgi:putative membrane protein
VKHTLMKTVTRYFGGGFTSVQSVVFCWLLVGTMFLTACGYVAVAGNLLPDEFSWMASVILFLSCAVALMSEMRAHSRPGAVLVFLGITASCFVLEYAGMTTGFPFGDYHYTDALGFRLLGVPVAIAAAWYTTVISTRRIAQRSGMSPLSTAVVAGLLTLAFDIVLEPMASDIKRYWIWESGSVPVQNYVAWFLVSAGLVYLLETVDGIRRPAASDSMFNVGVLLFGLQFGLFALTNAVHGHLVEIGISVSIVGAIRLLHMIRSPRTAREMRITR